jgi:hypothetical protein
MKKSNRKKGTQQQTTTTSQSMHTKKMALQNHKYTLINLHHKCTYHFEPERKTRRKEKEKKGTMTMKRILV